MPSSLSQARTRYPPAGCADLVNEFISRVAAAAVALGLAALRLTARVARQSGSQLRHRRGERKRRKTARKKQQQQQQQCIMVEVTTSLQEF